MDLSFSFSFYFSFFDSFYFLFFFSFFYFFYFFDFLSFYSDIDFSKSDDLTDYFLFLCFLDFELDFSNFSSSFDMGDFDIYLDYLGPFSVIVLFYLAYFCNGFLYYGMGLVSYCCGFICLSSRMEMKLFLFSERRTEWASN